jgi:hypothetical protein
MHADDRQGPAATRRRPGGLGPVTAALGVLASAALLPAATGWAQLATADRLREPGWWPTEGTPARGDYVGAARCASCHDWHAAAQPATAMARTLQRAAESETLRRQHRFRHGAYSYEIAPRGPEIAYTVGDGTRSLAAVLDWVFGAGNIGQTFVFSLEGAVHESRVSYFDRTRDLDFTPARALEAPSDPEQAIGRPVPPAEVQRCFGCHSTAATTQGVFDAEALVPGVTCEACHGPGREHVELAEEGRLGEALRATLNPARLDPAAAVDFCGACHATYWDVRLAAESRIAALRSQPYRLQSSRCWSEDRRLTCTACHDPHQPLVRDPVWYDARCLACHVSRGAEPTPERPAPACGTGTESCVSCHMPDFGVPGMPHEFADHRIRVVRPEPGEGSS